MEPTKKFGLIIGSRRFPLEIPALAVEHAPEDSPLENKVMAFRFTHRGSSWWGTLEDAPQQAKLSIGTDLGVFPYSAEPPYARNALATVLAAANAQCGQAFQVIKGRMQVATQTTVESPVSAVSLVSAVVLALRPLHPYLETIQMCQAFRPKRVIAATERGVRGVGVR